MDKVDLGKKLLEAFKQRNLTKFQSYLHRLKFAGIDSNDLSLFETVLSTPGCKDFVETWFHAGFDNYVNPELNKAAINYAVESLDRDNLVGLLRWNRAKDIVDQQYEGNTALLALCKKLCLENVEKSSECIDTLICFGASANIPDSECKTPLYYVLQNKEIPPSIRSQITCHILVSSKLNEEEYRLGLKFVLQFPPDVPQNHNLYSALVRHLRGLSTDDILVNLAFMQKNIANWSNRKMQLYLLIECTKQKSENVESALLNLMKINSKEDNISLVKRAIYKYNWKIPLHFLIICKPSADLRFELQKRVIQRYNVRKCNTEDYESCLLLLITEDDPRQEWLLETSIKFENDLAKHMILRLGVKLKVVEEE